MSEYLKSKESNCKNCYKCIRSCPVKSIRFSSDQANIINDDCILCGECYVACPQNAKEIRNDIGIAKALLQKGRVVASVAPSFIANFPKSSIASLERALQKLGFESAEETAIGATIVKKQYEQLVKERKQKVIISSCCHSVNILIQKYYPQALKYMAHVASPMMAHSAYIKQQHPDVKTVFIGPCISKKDEAETYKGIVDCVLTFKELSQWFEEEGITIEQEPDTLEQSKARLFPITGGIIRTMNDKNSTGYNYIAVDGVENCIAAIEDISNGNVTDCFVEMSACVGSCVGGPAMDEGNKTPLRNFMEVNSFAGKQDFNILQAPLFELSKNMPYIGLNHRMPGKTQIEEVLRKIGKTKPEHELNCGSCGYSTCREKAVAVLQGKANLTMCLPYLKEKAESFGELIIENTPNGIIVLNESMEVQQANKAALDIFNLASQNDILGRKVTSILDPRIFTKVLHSGENVYEAHSYLAEYGRHVIQSVVYDREYHLFMCFLRDITNEENQRSEKEELGRRTIEITNKVIEKQMRTVQEIASLLGETTAETKVALTNLKESLKHD